MVHLSAQFRPFQLRLNGKFPSPSQGIVLNHLDSCGNGECMRSASVWFNVDELESLYPGQFYGQPLVVTLNSAKAADAGSNYVASMSVQVVKNK